MIRNRRSRLGTLPCSQPAWIRCIKNTCWHSELPLHEQRAPRDGLLRLISVAGSSPSLRKKNKYKATEEAFLIANPKCNFDFFFFLKMYTFMMYKNGRTVTLCSITPSESSQFRMSKPQKLQNLSQSVRVDVYTVP